MLSKDAKEKVCPYLGRKCILEGCMFWTTTIKGKKEIDRKTEPYDMTPMDIGNWARSLKGDGYENIGREGGFRDVYAKYEETHEGYCDIKEKS